MNDQERASDYSYISYDLDDLNKTEILLDDLAAEKKSRYDDLLTDEIRQGMVDIDNELDSGIAEAEFKIAHLRSLIREGVLEIGETVKGQFIMAVWNKGRTSWDTKALNGYAAAHPSLDNLRKEGKPTVTIRKIK